MANDKIIISWSKNNMPVVTDKAMGFKIPHNGKNVIIWVPKSMMSDLDLDSMCVSIPEWLWDKKVNEVFGL